MTQLHSFHNTDLCPTNLGGFPLPEDSDPVPAVDTTGYSFHELIHNNDDITDEAQIILHRQLEEAKLQAQFPFFFANQA